MSHYIPYLALASLPAASLLALNPVRFSWGLHHGFEPMAVAVRDKAESVDRYLIFVLYALAAGFVICLMSHSGVRAAAVGLRVERWESNVAIGIAAGASYILIQIFLARLYPNIGVLQGTEHLQRRSVGMSLLVTLVAACVEEFWIAFCLVSMTATGYSVFISVIATAGVFAAVHVKYGLDGMYVVGLRGMVTALLFLWTGSLIPMVLFHFIGNLGNLYCIRRIGEGTKGPSGLGGERSPGV